MYVSGTQATFSLRYLVYAMHILLPNIALGYEFHRSMATRSVSFKFLVHCPWGALSLCHFLYLGMRLTIC